MRAVLSVVAAALALALAPPVAAQATGLCPAGPIRYAHYEFGLLYTPEKGGIDEDIRRELERRSGCRFEVSLRPRARIWRDLESGDLDMAGSGVQTPARDAFAWFAHYVIERNVVVLSPRVPASVRSFDDFANNTQLHLGGVRSFSYGPYLDGEVARLRQLGRVYDVADTRTLYRMFDFKRYDAFIGSQFLNEHYFSTLGLPKPKRIENWDQGEGVPSGLVLAKQHFSPAQGRAWQALVNDMLRDGTVRRIVAKYLGRAADGAVVSAPAAAR